MKTYRVIESIYPFTEDKTKEVFSSTDISFAEAVLSHYKNREQSRVYWIAE